MTPLIDNLEETISYRDGVTGVDHTIFISPKGKARHAPRIKVAIVDSIDPRSNVAAVRLDSSVVAGEIPPELFQQVRTFLAQNREALLAYWRYEIDTEELRQRLRPI
jgi:hypothetical protein